MYSRGGLKTVLIRELKGQKGLPELSAYKVLLKEGNVGTVDDFYNSLLPEELYYSHTGGQIVQPLSCVALELRYSSAKPKKTRGNYLVNYFANAESGCFSLFVAGLEQPLTCFSGGCTATAVVFDCFYEEILLVNNSDSPAALKGKGETDAYLHFRRIR